MLSVLPIGEKLGVEIASVDLAVLPEPMQRRLAGLRAVHSYAFYRAKNRAAQAQERAAGGRLIAELWAHVIGPEFRYRHRWQPGDLLPPGQWRRQLRGAAHNCAAQRRATFDYDLPLGRVMHRITVRGPRVGIEAQAA